LINTREKGGEVLFALQKKGFLVSTQLVKMPALGRTELMAPSHEERITGRLEHERFVEQIEPPLGSELERGGPLEGKEKMETPTKGKRETRERRAIRARNLI